MIVSAGYPAATGGEVATCKILQCFASLPKLTDVQTAKIPAITHGVIWFVVGPFIHLTAYVEENHWLSLYYVGTQPNWGFKENPTASFNGRREGSFVFFFKAKNQVCTKGNKGAGNYGRRARLSEKEDDKAVDSGGEDVELKDLLSKQNQSGETALYVAAECGYADLVKEMMKYYDIVLAGVRARNGYDAFHIAAKQGDLEVLKILMEANLDLSMTFDSYNTTALHTAASQGHTEVVNFLLEKGSNVAAIARSNGKTALHSAARNGHLEIVKALFV
ncbi:hypothetical protein CRYUN_Cryun05aG0247500 [Craigia yunnanensis]